jgi:hypothetical protein
MWKRILALLLIASLSGSLAACGRADAGDDPSFQSKFEDAVKAAERGKDVLKAEKPKTSRHRR